VIEGVEKKKKKNFFSFGRKNNGSGSKLLKSNSKIEIKKSFVKTKEKLKLEKKMLCGYIKKKGENGLIKSWKVRYFELKEDGFFFYFLI
jgi:hypothetical protein